MDSTSGLFGKVRLKLSFINGKGEWLSTHAQTFDCDSMSALAAEAQQMRTSAKQLENERSSGRPESRSKGVDR